MRIAIALCFSAILCTVYAGSEQDLEDTKLKIKSARWKVELTKQQIERVYTDTQEDVVVKVTKKWWSEMDNYREFVNLLVESMRREVRKAASKDVDAQYCFDTNYWAIEQYTNEAHEGALKCKKDAAESIKNKLNSLNNLVVHGDELIDELDGILLKCHSDDEAKTESCVLHEFGKVNTDVDEFQENSKYIEFIALPAANYVVLQANQCVNNVYLLAHFESQNAQQSNSRCVQDAIEKKKSLL